MEPGFRFLLPGQSAFPRLSWPGLLPFLAGCGIISPSILFPCTASPFFMSLKEIVTWLPLRQALSKTGLYRVLAYIWYVSSSARLARRLPTLLLSRGWMSCTLSTKSDTVIILTLSSISGNMACCSRSSAGPLSLEWYWKGAIWTR